jgi:hypothetical protein
MAAATGTITFSANAGDGSTLTFYGSTFEFLEDLADATEGTVPVLIGADAEATRDNLLEAILALPSPLDADLSLVDAEASGDDAILLTFLRVGTEGNVTMVSDDEDVDVSGMSGGTDGTIGSETPNSSLTGGTKTVDAALTPELLVATSTPCRKVWVGAPVDSDGDPTNTKPVFVGPAGEEVCPILPSNFEGLVLSIADALLLSVKVGVDGEGVKFLILS